MAKVKSKTTKASKLPALHEMEPSVICRSSRGPQAPALGLADSNLPLPASQSELTQLKGARVSCCASMVSQASAYNIEGDYSSRGMSFQPQFPHLTDRSPESNHTEENLREG